MFVIQPAHSWWKKENWKNGSALAEGFRYASDTNSHWLSAEDLCALVEECTPALPVLTKQSRPRATA
jgi:UDP-N-acetylglucosamine 4,6-dehydratase